MRGESADPLFREVGFYSVGKQSTGGEPFGGEAEYRRRSARLCMCMNCTRRKAWVLNADLDAAHRFVHRGGPLLRPGAMGRFSRRVRRMKQRRLAVAWYCITATHTEHYTAVRSKAYWARRGVRAAGKAGNGLNRKEKRAVEAYLSKIKQCDLLGCWVPCVPVEQDMPVLG